MEIELKGHSGCTVDIVRENTNLYIIKTTTDKKYIERLNKQAQKQISALMFSHPTIKVPKVISLEYDDNHSAIKMDYVYAKNYIDFLSTAAPGAINSFRDSFIDYVEKEIFYSPITKIQSTVLKEKFREVKKKIVQNIYLQNYEELATIMEQMTKKMDELPDSFSIPVGICHGDLTFSNVLFADTSFYLIDFLDSFIETPLMDIVKIRQDTAFLWSTQMYIGDNIDLLQTRIISEKIDRDIDDYFKRKYQWYNDLYVPFQLMNFLRILQYAHNSNIIDYLKTTLKTILKNEI
jgi:tRNA A-37 threonylcarbamoyl transferase component Bud32